MFRLPRGRRTIGAGSPERTDRFRATMLPHLDAAYGFARYLTRDPVTAEDVVQEAFLRAFRMYDTYHGGSARAWLFAIVRNCWRDRATADESQRQVLVSQGMLNTAQTVRFDTYPDPSEGAEAEMIRTQEAARVRSAIEALPEHLREVLVLRTFEDMCGSACKKDPVSGVIGV